MAITTWITQKKNCFSASPKHTICTSICSNSSWPSRVKSDTEWRLTRRKPKGKERRCLHKNSPSTSLPFNWKRTRCSTTSSKNRNLPGMMTLSLLERYATRLNSRKPTKHTWPTRTTVMRPTARYGASCTNSSFRTIPNWMPCSRRRASIGTMTKRW